MKIILNLFISIFLFINITSCKNNFENKVLIKNYTSWSSKNDSLKILLDLNNFRSFDSLRERIQEIICNDSLPQISFKSKGVIKNICPIDFCEKGFINILFKEKNIIELHNDTIFKAGKIYLLDSLSKIMRKDYSNNGKYPSYSDSPEKLIIYVSYGNDGLKKLNSILNIITNSYDKIKTKYNLNIYLAEKITILPPPPIPKFDKNNNNTRNKIPS